MKAYILRTILIALVTTPIYLIIRRPWHFKNKREIALYAFVVYVICLFTFTLEGTYLAPLEMISAGLERMRTGEYINLVPFRTISAFFRDSTADQFWINIISNVVIFIPWGVLLPTLWKGFRKPVNLVLMCLGVTVFIELYQLFIWRNTDIDDVILNFLGGIIGALIFFAVNKLLRGKNKN